MTNEELAAIKARVEAATPGPWNFIEGDDIPSRIEAGDWRIDLLIGSAEGWHSFNLIANAPTDITALIAEVERLQAGLQEQIRFNHLRNDRDAYLLAMAQWGLTGKWGAENENTERPQASEFGLEEE